MRELVSVAEQIAAKLIARKETIAVAESSTGGLISAALLSVAGAWRKAAGAESVADAA